MILSLPIAIIMHKRGKAPPSLPPTHAHTFTYGLKSFNILCLSSLIPFIYINFYSCICEKILKTPSKLLANILTLNLLKIIIVCFSFWIHFCHHFWPIGSGSIWTPDLMIMSQVLYHCVTANAQIFYIISQFSLGVNAINTYYYNRFFWVVSIFRVFKKYWALNALV